MLFNAGFEKKRKIKSKILETRLKDDYEFLKKLESNLEANITTVNKHNDENSDTVEDACDYVKEVIKDGIAFLDHRAEFWTNMK